MGSANVRADGTHSQYFSCLSCEHNFKQINGRDCLPVGARGNGTIPRSRVTLQLRPVMLETLAEMHRRSGRSANQSFEEFLSEHLENISADYRRSQIPSTVDVSADGRRNGKHTNHHYL
jgi:hypothetical protein